MEHLKEAESSKVEEEKHLVARAVKGAVKEVVMEGKVEGKVEGEVERAVEAAKRVEMEEEALALESVSSDNLNRYQNPNSLFFNLPLLSANT